MRKKEVYKSVVETAKELRVKLYRKLHPRIDLTVNLRRGSANFPLNLSSVSRLPKETPPITEGRLSSAFKSKIYNAKGSPIYSTVLPRAARKRRLAARISPEAGDYNTDYAFKKPRAVLISNALASGHCRAHCSQQLSGSVCARYGRTRKVVERRRYVSLSNFAKEVGRPECRVVKEDASSGEEEEEEVEYKVRELGLERTRYERQIARIHELKEKMKASMERMRSCMKSGKKQQI